MLDLDPTYHCTDAERVALGEPDPTHRVRRRYAQRDETAARAALYGRRSGTVQTFPQNHDGPALERRAVA